MKLFGKQCRRNSALTLPVRHHSSSVQVRLPAASTHVFSNFQALSTGRCTTGLTRAFHRLQISSLQDCRSHPPDRQSTVKESLKSTLLECTVSFSRTKRRKYLCKSSRRSAVWIRASVSLPPLGKILASMGSNITGYSVAAIALGGVAVVLFSAASLLAVGVIFQPRWLIKVARKQCPHILFFHATKEPLVALTIDDGPNGETTEQILDILQKNGCKATFFLIGHNMDKFPHLVKRMHDEGHEMGNHTMEDVASWRLPQVEFEKSLVGVDKKLEPFFHRDDSGATTKWFRPGHGWYTKQIRRTVQKYGYRLALGSVYPVDPLFKEKAVPIATYCLWKIYPGAVIVLHDRPQQLNQTIEILSMMLPEIRKRGYQVVTLSHLTRAKKSGSTSRTVANM